MAASWVIEHTPVSGQPLYWNGKDNDRGPPWRMRMAFVRLDQVATFPSETAALHAFRDGRRRPESCCQPVLREVA